MPSSSRTHLLLLTIFTVFSLALYAEIFAYDTFGPEFPLFYFYNDGLSFTDMLRNYTYTSLMWYRPTSFALFYWIGEQFIHWHNLAGWKLFHFVTVLAVGCAIYWMALRCLGAGAMGAFLAAIFYMAQPSLYAFVMEVAPFDFIYILLTVLCVGLFLLSRRASGRRARGLWFGSWLMFAVALTAKEMTLVIPMYLTAVSVIVALFGERRASWRQTLREEAWRLLPFFALLPAYYLFHLSKIPADTYTSSGPYRTGANWAVIADNLKRFTLWMTRIYAFTGQAPAQKMYQSTPLNNVVGISFLLFTAAAWIGWWRDRKKRVVLLLMLCWCGAFLALPAYAGGFIWHINLPIVGYSVLFGMAMSYWLERISSPRGRWAVLLVFLAGFLLLGRENMKTELYSGTHTTGFRINHSLIDHPPIAPARLGKAPLIYVEDRLGIGAWWYGCFGRLFNFAYLRHDIDEVVVPDLPQVPQELRERWLKHPNAHFVRYDNVYRWHDASEEFRASIMQRGVVQPALACVGPGETVQYSLATEGQSGGGLRWTISPGDAGAISADGLYTAPARITRPQTVKVSAQQPGDAPASAELTLGGQIPVRVLAGGGTLTDRAGRVWSADANYEGGKTYTTGDRIAGTDTPKLYQSERFNEGPLVYRFCAPDGEYTVRLKFAEIWYTEPGQRVFHVAINGTRVLEGFDVTAAAGGPRRAVDREFRVKTVDHAIRIELQPVMSNPKISAIEITP